MKKLLSLTALALTVSLTLTACTDEEESVPTGTASPSAPAEEPRGEPGAEVNPDANAETNNVQTDLYSFSTPEGWTEELTGIDPADPVKRIRYIDNATVDSITVIATPADTVADREPPTSDQALSMLTDPAISEATVQDYTFLDDYTALQISYKLTFDPLVISNTQLYAAYGDYNYQVNISSTTPERTAELTQTVLASWLWK